MQLNTLNRVIALFLVGGFVVVMAAVAFDVQLRGALKPYSELGAAAGVAMAVALLSITALAGVVVDALGNLSVRRVITKWIAKDRLRAGLFFCTDEFDAQNRWRQVFQDSLKRDPRHEEVVNDDMIRGASAVIFFRTAEKEHTEWLVQHYSMFQLSTNFVVTLLACATWAFLERQCCLALLSIAGAYLVTTFALDNYLYTYQLTFRNAYMVLNDVPTSVSTHEVHTKG